MNYRLISDEASLIDALSRIGAAPRIALDCEAAGFHRYTDRLCLVQLSTPQETFLLDPLAVEVSGALRPVLEDQDIQVVMHGADFDLRLLDRDLGIHVRGLFDTQAAATLLGADGIGLAALLAEYLDVQLAKAHQRADWARRPLPEELLQYAADDTRFLLPLRDKLWNALKEKGREGWAEEEFLALEAVRFVEDTSDPVTRFKGAHRWDAREITALRTALEWRDRIAREKDRAPFRVVSDSVLETVAREKPRSVQELADLKGMSKGLARSRGKELLKALRRVDRLPESDLVSYPRGTGNGPRRPSPEEESRADEIRALRTSRADELGVDRGVLLSNAQIGEIVRVSPRTVTELKAVPELRDWQVRILGAEIIRILNP
jgi:ribonuclease D